MTRWSTGKPLALIGKMLPGDNCFSQRFANLRS